MGPRMFIRGISARTGVNSRPSRELQWGRGCSSAESQQPGLPVNGSGPHASMGPRMFIRGIVPIRHDQDARWPASMGPRMFIRGIVPRPAAASSRTRFNGAADVHPRNRRSAPELLRASAAGFNGAADVHPRNRSRRRRHASFIDSASMGPRMFIRGIGHTVVPTSVHRSRRFNGAADVHPRNRGRALRASIHEVRLQWGRGCSSAESRFGVSATARECTASMGPRMFIRGIRRCSLQRFRTRLQWGRGCSSAESTARS